MADVEANVEINVEGGGGLRDIAAEAREAEEALDGVADAEGRIGAESGAMEGTSAELDRIRDKAIEAKAAQDALGDSAGKSAENALAADASLAEAESAHLDQLVARKAAAEDAARAEEALARTGQRTDWGGIGPSEIWTDAEKDASGYERTVSGVSERIAADQERIYGDLAKSAEEARGGVPAFEALQREYGEFRTEAEKATDAQDALSRSIQSESLSGNAAGNAGRSALDDMAAKVEQVTADIENAEPQINAYGDALGGTGDKAGVAAQALGEWHSALSSGDLQGAADSSRVADQAIADLTNSSNDAVTALGAVGAGTEDAEAGLGDLTIGAGDASGGITFLGTSFDDLGDGFKEVKGLGMPAVILGVASAATTMVPVFLSAASGVGAFAALAYPALSKVEKGLTGVTTAQATYNEAAAVEKRDPSASNLAAQQKALAQLQYTWAKMPGPVRESVRAIQSLGHAWSEAGKKSGIQTDALKDIPKVADDITGLIPSVEKLAQAAAPEISKAFTDIGKAEKSAGFKKFISNIVAEAPAGSKALRSLGDGFGALTTALTGKTNLAAGNKLMMSLGSLLKDSSPGAVSGLDKVAGALAKVNTAMGGAEKNKNSNLNEILGGAEKFGSGMLKSLEPYAKALHFMSSLNTSSTGRVLDKINTPLAKGFQGLTGVYTPGQGYANTHPATYWRDIGRELNQIAFAPPRTDTGRAMDQALAGYRKSMLDPYASLKAAVPKDLSAAKLGLSGKKTEITAHLKVDSSGAAKAKSDLDAIHKGAKSTTAKLTVKEDGAGKAKSDLDSLHKEASKPSDAKIKVEMSGADQAKSELTGLHSQVSQSWPQPKITVTVSGAAGAASELHQVGSAATGMAASMAAGATRATGAATAMAAGVKGAISPLPGEFQSVGNAAAQGMAAGIEAGTGAAVAAATNLAHAVESAARVELQTQSPSKKFRKIGADTIAGLILGIEGGKAEVQAAMDAVLGYKPFSDSAITSTVTKLRKDITELANSWDPLKARQASGLTRLLDTDNKKLMALAKQRQALLNQIKAADALAKSVESAAVSGASVVGIAGNTIAAQQQADQAEGAPGTAQNPFQNIQQGLKSQLSQIRQFRADIIKLKKEGLDKQGIQQILGAGVSGGLPVAQQILAEGAGGVKAIAKLQDEIGEASKKLGITGANAAYENASEIGKGLAAGLKDSLKGVDSAMASIAKTLVTSIMLALGDSGKTIKDALKKLEKEIDGGSGGGGGGGHKVTAPHEPGPSRHVTAPHEPAHAPIMRIPIGWGTGGGTGVNEPATELHANITLNVDGKTFARVSEVHGLRHAKRRPTTYPNLPGR